LVEAEAKQARKDRFRFQGRSSHGLHRQIDEESEGRAREDGEAATGEHRPEIGILQDDRAQGDERHVEQPEADDRLHGHAEIRQPSRIGFGERPVHSAC
jgi:hypothetical protein